MFNENCLRFVLRYSRIDGVPCTSIRQRCSLCALSPELLYNAYAGLGTPLGEFHSRDNHPNSTTDLVETLGRSAEELIEDNQGGPRVLKRTPCTRPTPLEPAVVVEMAHDRLAVVSSAVNAMEDLQSTSTRTRQLQANIVLPHYPI